MHSIMIIVPNIIIIPLYTQYRSISVAPQLYDNCKCTYSTNLVYIWRLLGWYVDICSILRTAPAHMHVFM